MNEIAKFYKSLRQEILTIQRSQEEGESQEQAFTRICLDMLTKANETDNAVLAYDEKALGTKNQHKINAYAISDSFETIDLFISAYEPSLSIENVEKSSIDRACTRITNFFTKAYFNNYENDVAETSQIFEFAHQLASSFEMRSKLIRVNAYILTNSRYKGDVPSSKEVSGQKIFYNIIDIEKLYSISEQARLPIELDFSLYKLEPQCMSIPTGTDLYKGYLTYLPGSFLAELYHRYDFKLLEQNVRAFLQFKAGINKGIKDTILKRPEMFFAFNNGISATADSIIMDDSKSTILKINNLQIVNGGQTTATLFHVSKEAGENLNQVLVPVKISVINDADKSYEIVKDISKYANTQNKINEADLSANLPALVEIEKLSRYMLTPITIDSSHQHYWFFDRISRQYENLLSQHSKTKAKKKAFELKYPKQCKFTKYELAKYYNSCCEIVNGERIIIGPHCVVDGNEVNFRAFRDYVVPDLEINNIFFEDLIAKAILFKEVDRRHGTKKSKTPPISDMKQVMVPYSIAILQIATNRSLNLEKIWKNQKISTELSDYMYNLMVLLNEFIKDNSPRSNMIEWATKEECWKTVKEKFKIPPIESIRKDMYDPETAAKRYSESDSFDAELEDINRELIKSITSEIWQKIADWGKDSGCLTLPDQNTAKNLAHKIQFDYEINKREIQKGIQIYEIVCRNNYDILDDNNYIDLQEIDTFVNEALKMLTWEKTPIILENWQFKIIQLSLKSNKVSKLRIAELRRLRRILANNGL